MSEEQSPLCPGLTGTAETTVREGNTAQALGSGSLPVFGTPAMLALMEQAACNALSPALPAGASTVGAAADIRHLAPTALGARVRAEAALTGVDGRRLTFSCSAHDEAGCIGEGTQVRVLVDEARFMQKVSGKRG